MSSSEKRAKTPFIALLNTTPEVIDSLQYLLESEGFNVVGAIVSEFRSGKRDFVKFMTDHKPDIIIYDLPPPYREQLNFLRMVRDMQVMQGKRFIYTTTNKKALEAEEGGDLGAHEIIGKPFDLDQLLSAVKKQVQLLKDR